MCLRRHWFGFGMVIEDKPTEFPCVIAMTIGRLHSVGVSSLAEKRYLQDPDKRESGRKREIIYLPLHIEVE